MDNLIQNCNEFLKNATKEKYLYHIKTDNFSGSEIYSLNKVKETDESKYNNYIKKYKGREDHITTKIKKLDCTWADVVNLSTINPFKIFMLTNILGIKNHKYNENKEIICIPISKLKNKEFCYYDDNISEKSDKAYSNFKISSYKETEFIPDKTVKYFLDCLKQDEDPLAFAYIKHVLVKDSINIKGCKVIKFNFSDYLK